MEAGKRKIEEIFSKSRTLEIPFFQRSYVWEEQNWERFLSDMKLVSSNRISYFIGSAILKQQPTSSQMEGDWRVIVDGQQRLTTIMMFFKVLSEVKNDAEIFSVFYNRRKQIILQHNHNDIEIFEAIIEDKLTEDLKNKYKKNNILQCYNYFKEQKEDLLSVESNNILDYLYFVGIDLGVEEDEQQIFDTINSLGVSLTTAELLKNELFRREDEGFYKQTWKRVFESDEDIREFWEQEVTSGRQHRINIDLFLQSYLLIKRDARDKYIGLDSLFTKYKIFLKDHNIERYSIGQKEFINSLIDYAETYKANINPHYLNETIDKDSAIQRLNIVIFGLNITTVVPYILYLLKEVSDSEERDKMFSLLESYLIRRLICKETTKNYNNLFASFVRNKVNSYDTLCKILFKAEDPTNRFPDDIAFMEGFQNSNLTNQQAKVVLYLIENDIRDDKRHSTSLLPVNNYSLEHIMPKKWEQNWSENLSNEEKEKRIQERPFLKLGNLTILTGGLNTSISNAGWQVKKSGKENKKGLDFYSSGITIFDDCLKKENWNEEQIKERGKNLFQLANKIWEYDKSVVLEDLEI